MATATKTPAARRNKERKEEKKEKSIEALRGKEKRTRDNLIELIQEAIRSRMGHSIGRMPYVNQDGMIVDGKQVHFARIFLTAKIVSYIEAHELALRELRSKQTDSGFVMIRGSKFKCDVNNRPVNKPNLKTIVNNIENGDWRLGPAGLVFDEKWARLDGQHRCAGVKETNQPIPIVISWGYPSDIFWTIDSGKNRSVGDAVGISLGLPKQLADKLAAATMWLYRWNELTAREVINYANVKQKITYHDGLGLCQERWPSLQESLQFCNNVGLLNKTKQILPTAISIASHCLITNSEVKKARMEGREPDTEFVDHFFRRIYDGEDLKGDDPVLQLRNFVFSDGIKSRIRNERLKSGYLFIMVIRAWNKTIMHYSDPETYPYKRQTFPNANKITNLPAVK